MVTNEFKIFECLRNKILTKLAKTSFVFPKSGNNGKCQTDYYNRNSIDNGGDNYNDDDDDNIAR